MANSSSTDERVDFTFYVPKAKRLIPLRLSNNTLEDFKRALNEANCVDDFREEVERTCSQSYGVVLITEQQLKHDSSIETCVYQSCDDGLTTTGVGTESSINNDLPRIIVDEPQEGDHDPLTVPRLSLKGYVLYTYMWSTFQWIEPRESGSYSSGLSFAFYKTMRVTVALSLWAVMAFEIFNLINGLPSLLSNEGKFTAAVAVMHRLLWTLRYVILHHLGVYFFQVHRGHINDVLNNSARISRIQWRKSHRLIRDLMAATAFFLVILPLLQKLIPIFIEHVKRVPRNWDVTVETVEFFVLVYSRFMAMPIFFFLILVVQIHILELKDFQEQIQQSDITLTELLRNYNAMTTRIQNSSRAFQPYLMGLLFLLVLWGTISVYSSVEMFQHIPPANNIFYGVFLSECLGTFVVFLCETVFLFSLPLYKSGQISSQLSRLIFTVTTLDSEDQRRRGFALNTAQKIALFAGLLERHQRYGNVGFKVAGLHITQLKSVWLTLLGPVIVFVGNVLLKEHF